MTENVTPLTCEANPPMPEFSSRQAVHTHPDEVANNPNLTVAEKRAILASWASDASAIASCPALRAPAGLKAPVSIDTILEALCELDGGPRNPPGGTPKRRFSTARALAA